MEKTNEIKIKTVEFSHEYSKLANDVFSTIRLHDKGLKVGEICNIKTPSRTFKAKLINKDQVKLAELSTEYLTNDTDTETRVEALDVLNSFYSAIEDVTILFFEKMEMT